MPVAVTAVLLLWDALVHGQSEQWTVYTRENSGLPDNNVLSLLATPEERLWVGTRFEGLALLDGGSWSYYKPPAPPGPRATGSHAPRGPQAQAIYDIALDSTGALWVGTKVHGLLRFDGATWTRYDTVNSALPDNYTWSVVIDAENRVWVGTRYGGVAVFDGGAWTIYNTHNSPLPSDDVGCLGLDPKQRLWIGTRHGLAILERSEWRLFTSANSGLPYDHIEAIAFDPVGTAWLGTFGGGLARFDDQQWQVYTRANSGLPCDSIYSLCVDRDGTVWVGTFSAGLAAFDGSSWRVFDSHNSPLPHDFVYETTVDRRGALWVATTLGLACYRKGPLAVGGSRHQGPPGAFVVAANWPNPFAGGTRLLVTLHAPSEVELSVFDLSGRRVCVLVHGLLSAGEHEVWWDGRDERGHELPPGLYLGRVRTPHEQRTVRLLRLP
ncbi:MAG: two-component regulator propeller domain-containing protein [bacterium]|jgi:ligand-binding sensor domain-containing protein|nr:hypothetical protein [candidate division KSB1 bacterium]MDH7560375.1 two-component regulator propeller domain-containing protein [bacterium]